MKQLKTRTKLAVALLASTSLLGPAVFAATHSNSNATTAQTQSQQGQPGLNLRISDNARSALEGVMAARLALMQGFTTQAKHILTQVKTTLGSATGGLTKATLIKYGQSSKASKQILTDSVYYPIGVSTDTIAGLSLPQGNATSPQPSALKNGSSSGTTQQATPQETVKTTVMVTLLPRDTTMQAIDTALNQIEKGNFAAAGQSLNTIKQSIVFGRMTSQASQPITTFHQPGRQTQPAGQQAGWTV